MHLNLCEHQNLRRASDQLWHFCEVLVFWLQWTWDSSVKIWCFLESMELLKSPMKLLRSKIKKNQSCPRPFSIFKILQNRGVNTIAQKEP